MAAACSVAKNKACWRRNQRSGVNVARHENIIARGAKSKNGNNERKMAAARGVAAMAKISAPGSEKSGSGIWRKASGGVGGAV